MLGRLLLLFLLTPVAEFWLFIQVDQLIGFGPTVGLIIATGIAGSYLARREGLNTWQRLNKRLSAGDLPGNELVEGVIILVAGALLVTPGVLTDVIGFFGLLPPTRALIRKVLMRRFKSKMKRGSMQVQFGMFGGAAPGPTGTEPNGRSTASPREEETEEGWQGTGRRMPQYTDEPPSSTNSS